MLYIFGVFFLTMTSSAVLMECLFRALHWIPPRLSSASFEAFVRFRFGATFGVTLAALVGTAVLYGLMRLQTRTDRGAGTSGGLELLVTGGCSMGCVPDRGDVPGRILRLALPIRRYVMTDKAATQTEEHTYQCPKCNCEFTCGEDEPEVCKCKQCGSEVDTGKKTCSCCA